MTYIGDLRRVALVITVGVVVIPSEIDRELGMAPFVTAAPRIAESKRAN